MSVKHCHACLKRGLQSAIYSACYECREFFCKSCSDIHPTFKPTEGHNIFKIILPAITRVASDVPRAESSDPPFAAQVVVNRRRDKSKKKRPVLLESHKKSSRQVAPSDLKVKHYRDINIDDSVKEYYGQVYGVSTFGNRVVVLARMLMLFDDSGSYLSSTTLMACATGITRVSDDTFATCSERKVTKWSIHGQTITCSKVAYDIDYHGDDIKYNGNYYCVLHRVDKVITILDRQGRHVRHITISDAFGAKLEVGYHIHMDTHSHDIYVSCTGEVLCVSVEGDQLWLTKMPHDIHAITEIRDILCVADCSGRCLHLLSKSGNYGRTLLEDKDWNHHYAPLYIHHDRQKEQLYVTFHDSGNVISVYSVGR